MEERGNEELDKKEREMEKVLEIKIVEKAKEARKREREGQRGRGAIFTAREETVVGRTVET